MASSVSFSPDDLYKMLAEGPTLQPAGVAAHTAQSVQQQQQQLDDEDLQPQSASQPFWQCGWSFGSHAEIHSKDHMEDRHVTLDLTAHEGFAGVHRAGLFAVFDGHGGTQAAEHLRLHYAQRVLAAGAAALATNPLQVLATAVQQCEREIVSAWQPGDSLAPGSTLCAVLLVDDKLHLVNVGDSRAVLVRGTSAQPLTQDHSPNCPTERRRISDADPDAISQHDDYLYGCIKLTRGIGSAHLKRDAGKCAYIATPDVSTVPLEAADDFVVLASDGFWDVANSSQYVAVARRAFARGESATAVSQLLVKRAKDFHAADNITVVVVRLHDRAIAVPKSSSRLQLM